jgi:hypothetical protein
MKLKFLEHLRIFSVIYLAYLPMGSADTRNTEGTWDSVTLSGKLDALSPALRRFRWQILDQARFKDDSRQQGMRFSEDLLYVQIGYDLDNRCRIGLGYVHEWAQPLGKHAYEESRPYEEFIWMPKFYDARIKLRSRIEHRINQMTGNVGLRLRQMVQIDYPLHFIDSNLGVYLGEEALGYINTTKFGRTGFSESRTMAGLTYRFSRKVSVAFGYLGQFVVPISGENVFTHTVQMDLRYVF